MSETSPKQTPSHPREAPPATAPESSVQEAAEDGLPGYGQPPPGVRTGKLEGGPEFDWDAKKNEKK